MNAFATELISIFRSLGVAERETVCCGTVTVPQCVLLQKLLGEPGDISSLAERVGISMSAMTRLVDGLERRGWVTRVRSADDRRKVLVELTDEGRREASRLRDLSDRLVGLILARIPEEKHAQVMESLRLLRAAVGEVRGELAGICGVDWS